MNFKQFLLNELGPMDAPPPGGDPMGGGMPMGAPPGGDPMGGGMPPMGGGMPPMGGGDPMGGGMPGPMGGAPGGGVQPQIPLKMKTHDVWSVLKELTKDKEDHKDKKNSAFHKKPNLVQPPGNKHLMS